MEDEEVLRSGDGRPRRRRQLHRGELARRHEVVVAVGDADFSTGGRSACGVLSIVIATRKGVRLPLASTSSPERTWRPSAREPVANVSSLPETLGAGAATPSSSAPGAVTGSLRSAGSGWRRSRPIRRRGRTRPGSARCCRSEHSRGRRASTRCRASRSRSPAGRRGRRPARSCRCRRRRASSCRRRSPSTCLSLPVRRRTTTRVAPPLVLAVSPTVPETTAPGSVSVTAGPVESTVTMTIAVVWTLPAASVMTARISASPSGAVVESQLAVYGAVVSLPTAVNEPAPNAFTSNATERDSRAAVRAGRGELHRGAADDRSGARRGDRTGRLCVVEPRRPRPARRRGCRRRRSRRAISS